MSGHRRAVLTCDGTRRARPCQRTLTATDDATIHQLRAAARRHGWIRHNRRDYCDDCADQLGITHTEESL